MTSAKEAMQLVQQCSDRESYEPGSIGMYLTDLSIRSAAMTGRTWCKQVYLTDGAIRKLESLGYHVEAINNYEHLISWDGALDDRRAVPGGRGE